MSSPDPAERTSQPSNHIHTMGQNALEIGTSPTTTGSDNAHQDDSLYPPSPELSHTSIDMHLNTTISARPGHLDSTTCYAPHTSPLETTHDLYDLDSWVWLHENLYLQPQNSLWDNNSAIAGLFDPVGDFPTSLAMSQVPPTMMDSHACEQISTASIDVNDVSADLTGKAAFDCRQKVIDDIVAYAAVTNLPITTQTDHSEYWSVASKRISDTFGINTSNAKPALEGFINLYMQHFWPLWPVLAKQNLVVSRLHPLLYLVLASIGAMYADSGGVDFGRLIHNKVRAYLTVAFELDDSDEDFTWLAQARLYTQVAALYFGQPKAFTYAQHLGALLVAQARRIELFSADQCERAYQSFLSLRGKGQDTKRLDIWLQLEARRRLAFGIFRVDTYTSTLMDTRPLLSLDEVDISFPYCDAVWRAQKMSVEACLYMIDHDRTPGRQLRASDIYSIALDPDEALPALDPVAHELLLFGLQRSLGRFAYDHAALQRLTSSRKVRDGGYPFQRLPEAATASLSPCGSGESGRLSGSSRQMSRLTQEFESMQLAQQKWERALPTVKTFVLEPWDRSSLMSGLVLFHLGYLRLHAPISKLHQMQYRVIKKWTIDTALRDSIVSWVTLPAAREAARRSCDLFALVENEASAQHSDRVKFNLLAFIGLHHAVVVLWAYATAKILDENEHDQGPRLHRSSGAFLEVSPVNAGNVINAFVDLFHQISPGRWSSFAEAAAPLARASFPVCTAVGTRNAHLAEWR